MKLLLLFSFLSSFNLFSSTLIMDSLNEQKVLKVLDKKVPYRTLFCDSSIEIKDINSEERAMLKKIKETTYYKYNVIFRYENCEAGIVATQSAAIRCSIYDFQDAYYLSIENCLAGYAHNTRWSFYSGFENYLDTFQYIPLFDYLGMDLVTGKSLESKKVSYEDLKEEL